MKAESKKTSQTTSLFDHIRMAAAELRAAGIDDDQDMPDNIPALENMAASMETFPLSCTIAGVSLEGELRLVTRNTCIVMLSKPYCGMYRYYHFYLADGQYNNEELIGRASWELYLAYEDADIISNNRAFFAGVLKQWREYDENIRRLINEAKDFKCGDELDRIAIDAHIESLEEDSRHYYSNLLESLEARERLPLYQVELGLKLF